MIVQVFAVSTNTKDSEIKTLDDIGLKGISKKPLSKSHVTFSGLRFITTSFYHDVLNIK